jgi:hypothetical protein
VVVENTSSGDDGGCRVAAPGRRIEAGAGLLLGLLGLARRRRRAGSGRR